MITHLLAGIRLIVPLGVGNGYRGMTSPHVHVSFEHTYTTITISGSLVKQKSNKHMTAIAPVPASEDKEVVISVSTLCAHTYFNTNTHMQSKLCQMMKCMQSEGESFRAESGMQMRRLQQTERDSERKAENEMESYHDSTKRKYQSLELFTSCVRDRVSHQSDK